MRSVTGHVLRATGVQIPEDDLDNLHSLREVDGTLVFVDPQDLLGSCLLADIVFITSVLLTDSVFLFFLGCDPLALVESLTPVECNTRLLETMFEVESVFVFSVDINIGAVHHLDTENKKDIAITGQIIRIVYLSECNLKPILERFAMESNLG
ncbi:hypothetical protein Tco_1144329 [Tanacetum coccineum]